MPQGFRHPKLSAYSGEFDMVSGISERTDALPKFSLSAASEDRSRFTSAQQLDIAPLPKAGKLHVHIFNSKVLVVLAVQTLAFVVLIARLSWLEVSVSHKTGSDEDASAHLNECFPVQTSARCNNQAFNFGELATASECARAAANHSGCGDRFMFSKTFPSWKCRCCAVGDEAHPHPRWELYSISGCGVNKTRESLREENLRLKKELRKMSTHDNTPEDRVSEIYDVLREVVQTLQDHRTELKEQWFAVGGTLIGALRSHPPGMMRWDDDVDLGVKASLLEDVHSVLKLNPRLKWKRHGQFLAYKYGIKSTADFSVEIFGLGLIDSKWHFVTPDGNNIERNFRRFFFKDAEIESTLPCKFWDLELQCPLGGLAHLQRSYGKNVMSEARIWNHGGTGSKNIDFDTEDLNHHAAYFPAMTRDLLNKLHFDER